MKLPLLTAFFPQITITLVLGIVSIVIFSNMHHDSIDESMRGSLRGSMLYAESRIANPFDVALSDAARLVESAKLHNASIFRGNDEPIYPHLTGNATTDAVALQGLYEHFQDFSITMNFSKGVYTYISQLFRVGRKTGTAPGSTNPLDFDWQWSGVNSNYYYHPVNVTTQAFFNNNRQYPKFTSSDVYFVEERGYSITGIWWSPANSSTGYFGDIFTWVQTGTGKFEILMPVVRPMSYDPVTGHITSLMQIDVDCNAWMTAFLESLNIPGGTQITVINSKTSEILSSSFSELAPGFNVVNASDPTKRRLWRFYDTPEPRLASALRRAEALGHPLDALPYETIILENSKEDDIVTIRPVRLADTNFDLLIVAVTERDYYFGDGERTLRDAIIICAVLLVAGLIVAIVTAIQLSRPLSDLGTRMTMTARLEDDHAPVEISLMSEFATLQDAYVTMKAELSRMKAFLPQGLMQRSETKRNVLSPEEDTVDAGVELPLERTSSSSRNNTRSGGESAEMMVGLHLADETNIVRSRNCVFAAISVAYSIELDIPEAETVLNDLFEVVFRAVDLQRGVVETLTPYQIIVTFGARTSMADPAGQALRMALRIATNTRNNPHVTVSTILDSGSVFVGTCGTSRLRQTIVFSEDVEVLKTISIESHRLHRQSIIATDRIAASFGNKVVSVPIDRLQVHHSDVRTLVAVGYRRAHELLPAEINSMKNLRAAFALLVNERWDEAEGQLLAAADVIGNRSDSAENDGDGDKVILIAERARDAQLSLLAVAKRTKHSARRYTGWSQDVDREAFIPTAFDEKGRAVVTKARAQKQLESLSYQNEKSTVRFVIEEEDDPTVPFALAMAAADPYATMHDPGLNECSFGDGLSFVNNWQLSEIPIGSGSFGRVYRGMHRNGALAAIKVLPLHSRGSSIEGLKQELAITSQLRHENLVGYVDAEVSEEELMVVMELVAGGSLASLMTDFGKLPLRVVRRLSQGLLRGLNYLHSSGIVHCDIKPQNVLVGVDGECKLADFGSALHPRLNQSQQNGCMAIGTPAYMAPEVARGQEPTQESDVWSFGMMVHELLTGCLPLNKAQTGMMETNAAKVVCMVGRYREDCDDAESLHASPRPNAVWLGGLSLEEREPVIQLLQSCLQVDPSKRPSVNSLLVMEFFLHS